MASTTDFTATRPAGLGRRILRSIGERLTHFMELQSRADQIQRLQGKSDAELARMGLRREDIVRHVFRDRFLI